MANIGDKYIIEISGVFKNEDQRFRKPLYKMMHFNSLVFDEEGISRLTPYEPNNDEEYQRGLNERFIMAGGHNIEVDPESVGQFTGLTDKDGTKIFEGDIVKTYDPDDIPAVVVYDESETQYGIVIDNIYYCLGAVFRGIDLEVIGNIHDNPELIEDGDADEEP